jgi:hypothetical protein
MMGASAIRNIPAIVRGMVLWPVRNVTARDSGSSVRMISVEALASACTVAMASGLVVAVRAKGG